MMDIARTEEKKKGIRPDGRIGGHCRPLGRAGIIVLALTTLSVMHIGVTLADEQPLPTMTVGYQNGTITAIYEKTIDIDGRTYGFMPDVVMLDEHGDMLDPSRLRMTAEVKFHIKKEQSNLIDKMIVTLPR